MFERIPVEAGTQVVLFLKCKVTRNKNCVVWGGVGGGGGSPWLGEMPEPIKCPSNASLSFNFSQPWRYPSVTKRNSFMCISLTSSYLTLQTKAA